MYKKRLLAFAVCGALALGAAGPVWGADDEAGSEASGPPKILLDKSPAQVAYQLKRLSNSQLAGLERKADEAKYKPVYMALLTRKGLEKKYREEAVEALAKLGKSDAVGVLLEAIGKVNPEDTATSRELAGLLVAQKPATLAGQREKLEALAKESESAVVKRTAYAGLATADGKPDAVWQLASENQGLPALLAGIPSIAGGKLREAFYAKVKEAVEKGADEATQVAAIDAISSIPGHEAEAFALLADIAKAQSGAKREAAVRSVGRIPASRWPKDQLEPLAQAIVKLVEGTPADQRTSPAVVQAVQLGNDLASQLGPEKGAGIRKSLRELAVRVVLFRTLKEQMMYDLRYFAVQAGKPVQVILENEDTMPHNIVFTTPGKMQVIAAATQGMAAPDDPKVKAFVPVDDPMVLQATHLVQPGESETLSFTAPAKPGTYPFLCTYPGHFTKMYGAMLVVSDLDEYEKNPTAPKDPMTKQPFDSQRNESTEAPAGGGHAEHQH